MDKKLKLVKEGDREKEIVAHQYYYYLTTSPNDILGPVTNEAFATMTPAHTYLRRENEPAFIPAYKHEDFIAHLSTGEEPQFTRKPKPTRDPEKWENPQNTARPLGKRKDASRSAVIWRLVWPKLVWLVVLVLLAGAMVLGMAYIISEQTGANLRDMAEIHRPFIIMTILNALLAGMFIHFLRQRMLFTGLLTAGLVALFFWGHSQVLTLMATPEENLPWRHDNVSKSLISYELCQMQGRDMEEALRRDLDPRSITYMLDRIPQDRLEKYFGQFLTPEERQRKNNSNLGQMTRLTAERFASRNQQIANSLEEMRANRKQAAHYTPGVLIAKGYRWIMAT